MCLVSTNKFIKCVAKEDIVCYKVVKEDLKSPCMDFQYTVGETYTSDDIEISDNVEYNWRTKRIYNGTVSRLEKGIHTICEAEAAVDLIINCQPWRHHTSGRNVYGSKVLECVIPKGTVYYTGKCSYLEDGPMSYASPVIKVIKILDFNNKD